jgi:hypothetical protein
MSVVPQQVQPRDSVLFECNVLIRFSHLTLPCRAVARTHSYVVGTQLRTSVRTDHWTGGRAGVAGPGYSRGRQHGAAHIGRTWYGLPIHLHHWNFADITSNVCNRTTFLLPISRRKEAFQYKLLTSSAVQIFSASFRIAPEGRTVVLRALMHWMRLEPAVVLLERLSVAQMCQMLRIGKVPGSRLDMETGYQ